MESLQGKLLIAAPELQDPNFAKTVVLLLQHGEEGALGVVLNRPTDKTVGELWADLDEGQCESPEFVYSGGPVPGPLLALHSDVFLAEKQVMSEVYVAASREKLCELVEQEVIPFKLFVGNAGWGAGQLEHELELGGWLTLTATIDLVFSDDDDLWERSVKQVGSSVLQDVLHIDHLPEDPSVN